MTEYLPDGTVKQVATPEVQEKIKNKKQELKSLKRQLKSVAPAKKDKIKTQIKNLKKELKMISPNKDTTW